MQPKALRVLPGITHHIIQRAVPPQFCFICDQDYIEFSRWLRESAHQHRVSIHAWVFLNDHIHLLATPLLKGSMERMLSTLSRRYTKYFNCKHHRRGPLFQTPNRSCPVQGNEGYLLTCQRYIELNPVRAGLVVNPARYRWSSHQCHALGIASPMHEPHPEYLHLGSSRNECVSNYRALFEDRLRERTLNEIRRAVNQGIVFGSETFSDQVEELRQAHLDVDRFGYQQQLNLA